MSTTTDACTVADALDADHVRAVLSSVLGGGSLVDDLVATVPRDRMPRTDEGLRRLGERYVQWSPLLRALEGGPASAAGPDLARQLEALRAQVLRIVAHAWPREVHGFGPEDATHDAVERIVRAPGASGYLYLSDLPAWLSTVALGRLRQEWRRARIETGTPPPALSDQAPADVAEWVELVQELRDRFAVVEASFDPANQPVARAVWREMMVAGGGEEAPGPIAANDAALAEAIVGATGHPMNKTAVATYRRRIRQRLAVIRFVRDVAAAGGPDEPGDRSLTAWLDAIGKRSSAGELPTLRALAALARATQADRTLAWALLAQHVHAGLPPSEAAAAAEAALRAWRAYDDQAVALLAEAAPWTAGGEKQPVLHEADELAAGFKVSCFVTACWLLTVLHDRPSQAVVAVLRPAPPAGVGGRDEVAAVTAVASLLEVHR